MPQSRVPLVAARFPMLTSPTSASSILIIGDDAGMRRLIEVALARGHLNALGVAAGDEAIAILGGSDVRLVILDLAIAGRTEYELLALRAGDRRLRSIPLIVVTADEDFDQRKALEYGVWVVLRKPFDPEFLQTVAASALIRLDPPSGRVVNSLHRR